MRARFLQRPDSTRITIRLAFPIFISLPVLFRSFYLTVRGTVLISESLFIRFPFLCKPVKESHQFIIQGRTVPFYLQHEVPAIAADRFLRNMVRAVVGTLLDVGRGKLTAEDFRSVIAGRDRSLASSSAPPQGLFLSRVTYPETIYISDDTN